MLLKRIMPGQDLIWERRKFWQRFIICLVLKITGSFMAIGMNYTIGTEMTGKFLRKKLRR